HRGRGLRRVQSRVGPRAAVETLASEIPKPVARAVARGRHQSGDQLRVGPVPPRSGPFLRERGATRFARTAGAARGIARTNGVASPESKEPRNTAARRTGLSGRGL